MWQRQWTAAPIPPPHDYKVQIVLGYARRFDTPTLIETGTYRGDMVEASRRHFQRIWSVELDVALSEAATARFRPYRNVTIVNGDSSQVLPRIVADQPGAILFWLDGHWSGGITARGPLDTPIVGELETVLERPGDNDVILIDDARMFGEGDYPPIEALSSMISTKRPEWHIEVRDDILRAHRRR